MQMRRLMMEVDEGARNESGLGDERGSRPAARLDIRTGDRGQTGEDPGNWPYLAI
jgi:hypothetical protein